MPFLGTHLPPAVANVRVGRHSFSLHRPSQSSVFVGANGVPRDWAMRLVSPDGPWPDPQFNLRYRLTDWAVEQLPDHQRETARDVDVVYYPVLLPFGSYSVIDPGPGLYWFLIWPVILFSTFPFLFCFEARYTPRGWSVVDVLAIEGCLPGFPS
nr:hypothetical protein